MFYCLSVCLFVFAAPIADEVIVRNLLFTFSLHTRKFDLNVSWEKPSFNYSKVATYSLKYRMDNGSDHDFIAQTVSLWFNCNISYFKLPHNCKDSSHYRNLYMC